MAVQEEMAGEKANVGKIMKRNHFVRFENTQQAESGEWRGGVGG